MKTERMIVATALAVSMLAAGCHCGSPYRRTVGRPLTDSEVNALNRRGLALLAECARERKHSPTLISPLSVDTAFAMLSLGAAGQAKAEIGSSLGLPEDIAAFAESRGRLASATEPQLLAADSIWIDERMPFSEDYAELVARYFEPAVFEFDNASAGRSARRMNAFVRKHTQGAIDGIVSAESIRSAKGELGDMGTGMVLIDALYFMGRWKNPFDRNRTQKRREFHNLDGTATYVDLMYDKRTAVYGETNDFQTLALPYRCSGIDCWFVAVLPKPTLPVESLLTRLAEGERLVRMLGECRDREVKIWLPKLDFECRTSLVRPLKAIGMQKPFESDIGSFPGITEGVGNKAVHRVDDVFHVTHITMDEEITKVVAATVSRGGMLGWAATMPDAIPKFRADHPYLGFIIDRETNLVLFAGVIRGIGSDTHPDAITAEKLESTRVEESAREAAASIGY